MRKILEPGGPAETPLERTRVPSQPDEAAAKPSTSTGNQPSESRGPSDWIVWQLADSAFPTGGYAHSNGLEAAWQHGEVRHSADFELFALAALQQLGHAVLPFVTAAHTSPGQLGEIDQSCDVFTTNHVANRASRLQGRALWSAVERIFMPSLAPRAILASPPRFAHFGPVFGATSQFLGLTRSTVHRLFFFQHLRGLVAAAVRLNILGPVEAQKLQQRLSPAAEELIERCGSLTLEEIAQTAPLLDLWQGAHDRLYSRLFQS